MKEKKGTSNYCTSSYYFIKNALYKGFVLIRFVVPILVSASLKLLLISYLSLLFNICFNDFALPLFDLTSINVS